MSNSAYITRLASFLPNAPIANEQMETLLGQVGDRPSRARRTILRANGIKTRYYGIDPATGKHNFSNAKLAAEAIRQLAAGSDLLQHLPSLSCGTSMPDQLMPSHASMVQGELALPPCEIISTAGVCVSGMAALKYAYLAVRSGIQPKAVATGSELASANMLAANFSAEVAAKVDALASHPELAFEKDFLRWMLSDGAGAALLEPEPAALGLSLRLDWLDILSYAGEMESCMYAGAEKMTDGSLLGWQHYNQQMRGEQSILAIKQDVKLLNSHIIDYTVVKPLRQLRDKYQLKAEAIDWFLPHYSSQFFRAPLQAGLDEAGLPIAPERWFTNLESKGNTGSASMYIMLDELFHANKLVPGQTLLCYVPESGRFATAFMHLTVVGR